MNQKFGRLKGPSTTFQRMPQIIPEFGGTSAHMRLRVGAGIRLSALGEPAVWKRIARFAAMNEVYAEFFGDQKPARTTVEAKFAVPQMKVEIDCIAYKPK